MKNSLKRVVSACTMGYLQVLKKQALGFKRPQRNSRWKLWPLVVDITEDACAWKMPFSGVMAPDWYKGQLDPQTEIFDFSSKWYKDPRIGVGS